MATRKGPFANARTAKFVGVISNRGWNQGESPAMAWSIFRTEEDAKRATEGLSDFRIEPVYVEFGELFWVNPQPR